MLTSMGLPIRDGRCVRTERLLILSLALATFALRLGAVAVVTGLHETPKPGSDESEYDAYAWNLIQGKGYVGPSPDVRDGAGHLLEHPTAYRPPVAPFFFAAVYAVAGHNYVAAHVANSLVASLTVLLIFLIARRVFGREAAWLAAVAYALYPLAVYYNLTLQSESLAAFLVCLFVWLCLPFKSDRGYLWAAGAGVALGLLLLCKPGFIFLILLLPVWAWGVCRWDRSLWLRATLLPTCAALVILPWAARNYHEFGKVIPFGTGGGSLLLQANNRIVVADPKYRGYAVWDTSLPEYAPALRAANDEVERDAIAKRFAIEWLRENPDKWFYLARGKFWRLWTPQYFGTRNRELALVATAYVGVILLGFAASVLPVTARLVRQRDPALMVLGPIVATVMMAVVFHGQHRYRFPIDSLCLVIAAGGATWVAGVFAGGAAAGLRTLRACAARNRVELAAVALLIAGLGVAWEIDEGHIRSYRASLDRQKRQAIADAVVAYRDRTGRLPDQLGDLVPEFLPNVEALHAPTHSLEYCDYQLLGCRDAREAPQVISYELRQSPETGGEFRIARTHGTPPDETDE